MNWFALALIGPLFWSITNHIDKFVLNRYFQRFGIGAIAILVALVDSCFIPICLLFNHQIFTFPPLYILILIAFGSLSVLNLLLYFHTLNGEDTSIVVPLFQLTPVLTYFLAYFSLHEALSQQQIIASLLIILGAIILSLDITNRLPKIKTKVLALMTLCCLLVALNAVVFKYIAIQNNFWATSFWNYVGSAVMATLLFTFVRPYRISFLNLFRSRQLGFISLNSLSETLTVVANIAVRFATLLAPVTLVWVVNGFQPAFVFIIGLILTLFFPHIYQESLLKRHLFQKVFSIGLILAGTYLLNS